MTSLELIPPRGPLRQLTLANLISAVGTGLYLTGSTLYFTRVAGLPVGRVAAGLAPAIAVGLALMTGFGRLADHWGPKPVYIGLLLMQAAAMAAFTQVRTEQWFLVVAIFSGIADRALSGTMGAFLHAVSARENLVVARAQLRTTVNIGLGGGTLLAGLALAVNTAPAYTALIAGNAALFTVSALMMLRLPVQTEPGRRRPRAARTAGVLRDRRYLAVTAANGLLSLHGSTLTFALPLWVADHTSAPTWTVSLVLIVNMAMAVVLQVQVSRRSDSIPSSARMAMFSGLFLAGSCLVMTVTTRSGAWLVILLLLLVWVVMFSVGELTQSAAQFFFGFALAPDEAMGSYQSVFALGQGVVRAAAPLLLTVTVLDHGAVGWLVLGAFFVVSGWLTARATKWAAEGVQPTITASPSA